jgi:hypothetical protein
VSFKAPIAHRVPIKVRVVEWGASYKKRARQMPIFESAPTLRSEYFSPTSSAIYSSKTSAGCTCDTCESAARHRTARAEYQNKKDKSLVVNCVTCVISRSKYVIRARQVPVGLRGIDSISQRSTPERLTITHTAAHDAAQEFRM